MPNRGDSSYSAQQTQIVMSYLSGLTRLRSAGLAGQIVVDYNAPNSDLLKKHYENMPEKFSSERIKPTIPWLYDFKLDFCFKEEMNLVSFP